MEIDRRAFLIGSVLAIGAAPRSTHASTARAVYASACRNKDGTFGIALLSATGAIVAELPLAARAHDIAWAPATDTAVAFARQPGRFAVAFSPHGTRSPTLFAPPDDRCFFGHGVFSPGGRLLYATENDLDEGVGRIGIYDASAAFARIGEFASGGVGPHELLLPVDDGLTLVVANGGYETLPATGRQAISVSSMHPSLVFIDRRTGEVKARHELPNAMRALSIRHLAAGPQGRIWFGGQWEGDADATPEIVGSASLDGPLTLIAPETPLGPALKGYIGSVAISRDGKTLAASAPRAGRTILIDVPSGTVRGQIALADNCGIAATADGFAISSGHGHLMAHRAGDAATTLTSVSGRAFDNHLRWLDQD